MIEVSYASLNNPRFNMAFGKLMNAPLNVKTSYQLKKIADALIAEQTKVQKLYTDEIVNKFGKKDEKGELIHPANNPAGFDIPEEAMEAFNAANVEFQKRTFTIDRTKILLADLGNLTMAATELTLLEPFYTDSVPPTLTAVGAGPKLVDPA